MRAAAPASDWAPYAPRPTHTVPTGRNPGAVVGARFYPLRARLLLHWHSKRRGFVCEARREATGGLRTATSQVQRQRSTQWSRHPLVVASLLGRACARDLGTEWRQPALHPAPRGRLYSGALLEVRRCLTLRWRDASSGARAYTKTDKEGEHDAWALDDEAFAAFDNVTASARGLRASGRRALQGSPLTEQCPLSLESGTHILCPWFSKACASGARSTLRHAETAGKFQTEAGLSPRQLMGAERCVTQACLKHSGTARKPRRSDRALLARSTAVWESGFRSGRRDPRSPVQTLQSAL